MTRAAASQIGVIMAIWAVLSVARTSRAFVFPSVTRRTLTTTVKKQKIIGDVTKGRRRERKRADGESLYKLVDRLQKEKGLYKDFQYGMFVTAQDAADLQQTQHLEQKLAVEGGGETTTFVDTKIPIAELPEKFPLQGCRNIADEPPRMRFAPSPTGSLHVGGARTALYNWLVARKGKLTDSSAGFVLRIEDTDVARSTKESEQSVLADLRWLGLHWDEGPELDPKTDILGNGRPYYGPYRQSERADVYFAAANRLLQEGKAYRCFCSPEELEQMKVEQEARGETPRYDGRWRDADIKLVNEQLDKETPFTVRFKVADNARVVIDDIVRGTVAWDAQASIGDFILLRSSGVPVYNFCVAVDDACMGVTTVVRAEEHLTNTLRQALILDALDAPRPRYAHCSLILGQDKQKLSKRHGATSVDQYRLDGFLPDAMINYLALLGWADGTDNEIFTRDELIEAFELERVVKSPSVFDLDKLKWVNGQHMKQMSVEQLLPFVEEQIELNGMFTSNSAATAEADTKRIDFTFAATSLAKQMMLTLKDAATNAMTVLQYDKVPATYQDMVDGGEKFQEAKELVHAGYFYNVAMKIVEQYEAGIFPTPNDLPLAAFTDAMGQAIEEDSQKGATCEYTTAYVGHMKAMAKELDIHGRHFFHPIRLALTGEMSGQDVTKQLSLLALATSPDSVINAETVGLVSFAQRMERLKGFCETIPEEYRTPKEENKKSGKRKGAAGAAANADSKSSSGASSAAAGGSTTTSASSSAGAAAPVDPKDSYLGPPISALDIRVGKVLKVWEHPEAEKLYCEEIDVGEAEPRQIASGLRPYLQPEDLEGRKVLVLCNLKERKLVGFPSHGMVLCASNQDHTQVRLVNPPIDAKIGERVTVPDFSFEGEDGAPFAENKVGKKKVFEGLAPHLVTNQYGVPQFLGRPFMTSAGICTSPISDGSVS